MPKPRTTAVLSLTSIFDKSVSISTSGTRAAPGSSIIDWHIHWGDGTTNKQVNHDYLQPGEYKVELFVVDSKGRSDTAMIIIRISDTAPPPPALQITTASLPGAVVGSFYSQQLSGSGGIPPYSWAVFSGSLPPGLSLASDTIQGTPTSSGTFNFNIRLRDSVNAEAFRDFQIVTTASTLVITTPSTLGTGVVGIPYSTPFAASGGVPPYAWNAIGSLPNGMSLPSSGVYNGTPTTVQVANFTARVVDSILNQATKAMQHSIIAASDNSYFDALMAHASRIYGFSLRTPNPTAGMENSSAMFTYDFANDPYPDKQDAAKLIFQPQVWGNASLPDQARTGIHQISGTHLIIWEDWYGPEFRTVANGGLIQVGGYSHKVNQFAFNPGGTGDGSGDIFVEPHASFSNANATANPIYCAAIGLRVYPNNPDYPSDILPGYTVPVTRDTFFATGTTINNGLWNAGGHIVGGQFWLQRHSTWTRHIMEITLNQPRAFFSEWEAEYGVTIPDEICHAITYIVCDRFTAPKLLCYKAPIRRFKGSESLNPRNGLVNFWWEYNTSSDVGDFVGQGTIYNKNMVYLRNYVPSTGNIFTDSFITQQPVY